MTDAANHLIFRANMPYKNRGGLTCQKFFVLLFVI